MTGLDRVLGLVRSLWIYRRPGRLRGLMALYRPFIQPGDLVFDIGAHLGDRTRAFRRLGARVVALEPQPDLMHWLHRFHGRDTDVVLEPRAAGARAGRGRLALAARHPAVASLSKSWRDEVRVGAAGFEHVRWTDEIPVDVTTLDALIEAYGRPSFCKIDVEGHEAAVLAGLSSPIAAVSVEFVGGALDRTVDCVDRLETLAGYRYNAVAGEGRRFLWSRWQPADQARRWLDAGADGLASGDLYAVLDPTGD
jgi:FkbM family methyltransferase